MKAVADDTVRFHTIHFFRVLQAALRSPATAPLSQSDLQLSGAFNRLFAAARRGNPGPLSQMIAGARAAHAMIIHRWPSHTDPHHWTYFSNFANWLPVPRGRFDLLLRIYGPEGNTSPGAKYIPPEIQP